MINMESISNIWQIIVESNTFNFILFIMAFAWIFKKINLKGLIDSLQVKIIKILDEYVKPAVANDGGNIDLIEFDEETKTAKMLLQGACSGCPSSTITLKNGIETMLKQMLPGKIENVEAINA